MPSLLEAWIAEYLLLFRAQASWPPRAQICQVWRAGGGDGPLACSIVSRACRAAWASLPSRQAGPGQPGRLPRAGVRRRGGGNSSGPRRGSPGALTPKLVLCRSPAGEHLDALGTRRLLPPGADRQAIGRCDPDLAAGPATRKARRGTPTRDAWGLHQCSGAVASGSAAGELGRDAAEARRIVAERRARDGDQCRKERLRPAGVLAESPDRAASEDGQPGVSAAGRASAARVHRPTGPVSLATIHG